MFSPLSAGPCSICLFGTRHSTTPTTTFGTTTMEPTDSVVQPPMQQPIGRKQTTRLDASEHVSSFPMSHNHFGWDLGRMRSAPILVVLFNHEFGGSDSRIVFAVIVGGSANRHSGICRTNQRERRERDIHNDDNGILWWSFDCGCC